jgi:hypothetical protein
MNGLSTEPSKDKIQAEPSKIPFWRYIWCQISPQWSIFLQIVLQPGGIICIVSSAIAIILSYNSNDRNLSLILSIAASALTSVFGALCYDRYKEISGNTVLVKKGQGAVRSLYIIVEKIKNISLRAIKNKNFEETENLLSLVEKDVNNSINEWTDVLPNIVTSNAYTNIIIENIQKEESNLNDEINRNNELQKQLNDTIEKLNQAEEEKIKNEETINNYRTEKEKLETSIDSMDEKVTYLEKLVNKLKVAKEIAISTGTSGTSTIKSSGSSGLARPAFVSGGITGRGRSMNTIEELMNMTNKEPAFNRLWLPACKGCGITFSDPSALDNNGLCHDCSQSIKS